MENDDSFQSEPFLDWDSGDILNLYTNRVRKPYDYFELQSTEWRYEWADFKFGRGTTPFGTGKPHRTDIVVVPFWSIAMPLTLISAWCLLTKCRTKPATEVQRE
jgi:hypothetical protein